MFIQRYKCRVPLFLTKYITKSIINGVKELNTNNIIHCDIKSDNVLLKFSKAAVKANGKKIKLNEVYDFFKLYDQFINGKTHMADIINSFSIKLIDFNKSQFINQICKDTNIQILYYQAPEVVFGDEFNESVDMWSIGCIIYELITGHQLFDIYNKKSKYGELYENYEIQNEDDSANGSGDSKSVSSYSGSSYYDKNTSYYDGNELENYAFLLKVISIIGPLPSLPEGKHVETYIMNNNVLGGINVNIENINDLILKDKLNHQSSNFDTEIAEFINLLKSIFVYDINKRVKASDII
jgi:serine/threonine protein kinase